jgi:hypothetical protein
MSDDPAAEALAARPDLVAHQRTLRRLQAAGLISAFAISTDGHVTVIFSDDYLLLLQAGRDPMNEPGFLEASATGDPLLIRQWLEGEAQKLRDGKG